MTNPSIALIFLRNEAGEDEGLGHAGIETYKDAPYTSVGRECGQNSADAMSDIPVEMRFDLRQVPVPDYPMHAAQVKAVEQCLVKARQKGDDKEIEFFLRAQKVLANDSIPILTIADRNTKGLVGPATPGTPFHSLVKSTGVSNKDSETSGGSFGIGKNAAFAVSELQTVFYSTEYADPATGKVAFLAQGKTILISHRDSGGEERRATGYWGLPGFEPVANKESVPAWLRRDGIGTSVVIAGFRESTRWEYRIAASLLQNFFCALYRGEIRFLLDDGGVDISKDTIENLFDDEKVVQAAKDTDEFEDFVFAKNLYECLKSPDAIARTLEIDGLGPVSLRLLMRDGLPKRVRIVRNGMAITDELGHFGDKFASFPMYKDFVALVEPSNSEGGKLIKRLENPRHNGLSAERLADPAKRAQATAAMKRLAKSIRAAIKEQALTAPEKRVLLNELSEFFDAPNPSDSERVRTDEENPEILTYNPVTLKKRTQTDDEKGTKGLSGGRGTRRGRSGRGRGRGTGRGRGRGGSGGGGDVSVQIEDFRNTMNAAGSGYARRLFFTPDDSGKIALQVMAAGMDSPTPLKLTSTNIGQVESGALLLDVSAGNRYAVDINFSEGYAGPIELIATKSAGDSE